MASKQLLLKIRVAHIGVALSVWRRKLMSEKSYNVSYVANYFTLNTTIQAPNQDQAEALAKQNLLDEYGIDLDECGAECIEVTTNV
jgi:hypothetical protein